MLKVNYRRFKKGWGDFGAVISGNGGAPSSLPEQLETNISNEMSGNVEVGDGVIIGDIGGVVGGERLEFREEQAQCGRKKGNEEEQHVYRRFPFLGK